MSATRQQSPTSLISICESLGRVMTHKEPDQLSKNLKSKTISFWCFEFGDLYIVLMPNFYVLLPTLPNDMFCLLYILSIFEMCHIVQQFSLLF